MTTFKFSSMEDVGAHVRQGPIEIQCSLHSDHKGKLWDPTSVTADYFTLISLMETECNST